MIKYPWLHTIYNNMINHYKNKNLHHSIMIESYNINNTMKIIWNFIQWIFCSNPIKNKYCCKCQSCTLIKQKNHPDFYLLIPKKKKKYISVEYIRNILRTIQNTSQQNNMKVIWIPNYKSLTILGINILLKNIEEPPKNTFFFIGNEINYIVHTTLRSRLLLYKIVEPTETIGIQWLQKYTTFNSIQCIIALRYNYNNPELAQKSLQNNLWFLRQELYNKIFEMFDKNNFLLLLPILYNNNVTLKIYWMIILLLDSLKLKEKITPLLINIDQYKLIHKISNQYSYKILYKILFLWQKCRYKLINIKNVNHELLILKYLLQWNNITISK